jgi:hypothetical protein
MRAPRLKKNEVLPLFHKTAEPLADIASRLKWLGVGGFG